MKEALTGPGRANLFALSETIPFPRRPSLNDRPNHRRGRLEHSGGFPSTLRKRRWPRVKSNMTLLIRQAPSLLLCQQSVLLRRL